MPQHRLYGLRGQDYIQAREQIFEEIKDDLTEDFQEIVRRNHKFTPKNFGELANKYLIPLTVLDAYLSHLRLLSSGTLDKLKDRGFKAKDVGVVWKD